MDRLSRRNFLKAAGIGAAAAVGGSALAPGLSSASLLSPSRSELPSTRPRRGGTLSVGFIGGSSSDTLNPMSPVANVDYARVNNLFDPLVRMTTEGRPVLALAEEIEPNKDATTWTVRVRSGVTFHNGKELTAEDVLHTFQSILNPKSPGEAASSLSLLNTREMRRLDRYTARLPFKQPYGTFLQVLSTQIAPYIIPVDFDLKHPVETGPFKYKSFTPGVQSTFLRNDNYWKSGLPYADRLVMTDYGDELAQANALVSGEENLISGLSTDVLSELKDAGKTLLISDGGGWNPFTMRVDSAPFN
ncbi:MAG: ABC transporter substrate-binding protein, partial [Acidimicrobiales bacterium]